MLLCEISSEIEAILIQGRLESEGIPCSIENLTFQAVKITPQEQVRLYVLEEDFANAQELANALRTAEHT